MVAASQADIMPADDKRAFAEERARIDASCRGPVLVFFASSLFWLMLGSVLALTASIKLHTPGFLTDVSWLTFGRVRPAHLNTVAYGWASMVGIGMCLWLMCRLSRVELLYPKMLIAAAGIWNFGVGMGIVGILMGYSTGVEWLEFPKVVPPFLVLALSIVSAWTIATFRNRREKHVYVTQWYIFGAMFWMPWLYSVATIMIIYMPATGVVQAATNWWYAHNVLGLWITPIGVGTAYYLIPKVLGRPVYSYYLSVVGFWALALFYSWAGMHHLIGGPVPAWLVSASIVGSMMMFIPVGAVALNHHMTLFGHFREIRYSPTLRFIVFGAIAYTATSFQGSIEALRWFSERAHFTHYTVAHAHLGLYGFFTMIMFGGMYYVVPRLTGTEWASSRLIRAHFWLTAVGITIYFTGLTIGGWFQGNALINVEADGTYTPFIRIVRSTVPWLISRSFAGTLMTTGHAAFALLFVLNLMKIGKARGTPMYFRKRPEKPAVKEKAEMAAS